ncbi:MAG: hypothetical protein HYT06_01510 [Candidatus Levybacteria bacterium]|nr:hypothetical protein [Candidatus Levybacteria bacterium]
MRYSLLFPKILKDSPSEAVAINHKLLVRAGYIDQLMAGSFTLLPLGFRVVEKIKNIIRDELNKTGAQELLMPLLHPKDIWDQTGRWSDPDVKQIMYQFKDIHNKEYGLSFTHEEIVLDLLRKHTQSYKDFPVKIYHFSTKFRNELRVKSGILRTREFLMKDLYSAHESAEDLEKYYNEVKDTYVKIFARLGLKVIVTEAGGGVFTKNVTHEFQVIHATGEDEIIYCPGGDFAQNVEIATVKEGKECVLGHGPLKKVKTIEVGNIFNFGQDMSKKMNITFTDRQGKQQYPYFASYGIGPTRILGTLAEIYNDENGLIFPKQVCPFDVHLISLNKNDQAGKIEDELEKNGFEVFYDDRDISAGEKFATADLIGIPVRLVVSKKTGDKIEYKQRDKKETELLILEEILERLK